ncbi:MAG: D-glycero-beta-D-manno-heptose 1-phosphate adenylyltransferase [Candidatus Omnitrophica bacterium]|nr:D-glycero-beta-D-manno-heptose 1-phosphate adenylyltransferase [Candidatus Omnitrophota bacterium]
MRTHGTGRGITGKIKSRRRLKDILTSHKRAGRRIVFTNGCFDILHYGHAEYLQKARGKGDILVVAVNSDSSVRAIKGVQRPLVGENDHARLVAALESVDYVTIFRETTPYEVIRALKPDILVKGADWKKSAIVGAGLVKSGGGRVVTIKLAPGRSTSRLINKIAKTCTEQTD